MPKYTIKSGDMLCEMETTYPACAIALATLAVDGCDNTLLAKIIEVSGGQFVGDNVTYVSTLNVLRNIGAYPPEGQDQDQAKTKESN